MKKTVGILLIALFLRMPACALGEGTAGASLTWKEELPQGQSAVSIEATVAIPTGDAAGVWDVAPATVTENQAYALMRALFTQSNPPQAAYGPVEDYAAEDQDKRMYAIHYDEEQDGQYRVLDVSYIQRLDAAGSALAQYSNIEEASNGAELQSSLQKASGTLPGVRMTMEEAIAETSKVIRQLEPEFTLFMAGSLGREAENSAERKNPETIPHMYGLIYTRSIAGIPILYHYGSSEELPLTLNGLDMPQEFIAVMVGDNGIAELVYQGAIRIGDAVQKKVALLGFEQIQAIAREKLTDLVTSGSGQREKGSLHIHSVIFGYRYVAADDGTGRILLTPAWNFYGTYRSVDRQGKASANAAEDISLCVLTLDAQTGDVIPE